VCYLEYMVEIRCAVYAEVKGGEVPDMDVPMSEAFLLDEPIYDFPPPKGNIAVQEGCLGL
jgi:hypothetical protein